jgi:hypothetical protein
VHRNAEEEARVVECVVQVLAVISAEMGSVREVTRLAALNWMTALLAESRATVRRSRFPEKMAIIIGT